MRKIPTISGVLDLSFLLGGRGERRKGGMGERVVKGGRRGEGGGGG